MSTTLYHPFFFAFIYSSGNVTSLVRTQLFCRRILNGQWWCIFNNQRHHCHHHIQNNHYCNNKFNAFVSNLQYLDYKLYFNWLFLDFIILMEFYINQNQISVYLCVCLCHFLNEEGCTSTLQWRIIFIESILFLWN